MREEVVFQANAPVTVALAYADGLPVQGRFGGADHVYPN